MSIKVSEKSQDLIIKIGLYVALYLLFAKPVLNYLGITKSRGDKIINDVLTNPNSALKPSYWQQFNPNAYPPAGVKISTARKNQLQFAAKEIYEAMGYFTDDEEKIQSAFLSLKTKSEVSLMSYFFTQAYQKDLVAYLVNGKGSMPQNGLGDYDLQTIISFVSRLPEK